MNILLVSNVPFKSVGGRIQRLVEEISKDNTIFWIDPPVVNSYDSKEYNKEYKLSNVNIFKTPSVSNIFSKTICKEYYSLRYAKRLGKRIDICLIYDGWGTYFLRRYLKKKRVPVIFDYVDKMYEFLENKLLKKGHKYLIYDAFKTSDAVICTANKLCDEARKINKNSFYIPNGSPKLVVNKKKKKNGKIVVGYLGAFGDWVNFEILNKSIKGLKDVEFYFVGGGEREKFVESLDKKYENVHRIKPVQYQDVPNWIDFFDICIIHFKINKITNSVSPLKLFEYWSLKKTVICTSTYEIKKTGRDIVQFADTEDEFYDKINELANDKKKRMDIGRLGYNEYETKYSFEILSKRFMEILNDEYAKKNHKRTRKNK